MWGGVVSMVVDGRDGGFVDPELVFGGGSRRYIPVREAAGLLGVGRHAVFKLGERGRLELLKVRVPGTRMVLSVVSRLAVLELWRERKYGRGG